MSRHDVIVIGFAVIALGGVALEMLARRTGAMPTIDAVLRWTLRTHSGRIALFATWAWLGLHFLG